MGCCNFIAGLDRLLIIEHVDEKDLTGEEGLTYFLSAFKKGTAKF